MDSERPMPGPSAVLTTPSTMELGTRYFVLFDSVVVPLSDACYCNATNMRVLFLL